MATGKKRLSIAMNDALWEQLFSHRARMERESRGMVVSLAEAAVDLLVKGLVSDGIEIGDSEKYEDLRRKADDDIRRASSDDDDDDGEERGDGK